MKSVKQAYRDFLNTPEGAKLYRQFKRLLYAKEDSLVQWLNTCVLKALPASRGLNVRVCDIGGGDGDRITRILQVLRGKFRNRFSLDFVEQSAVYAAAFNLMPLEKFCRTKVYHSLFEDVRLPIKSYDLVLLIHSIFAFENEVSAEKVLSLRRSGGSVVVVSNASNSFLGGLKRLVDEGFADRRFEIIDLERVLRRLGVKYRRRRTNTEWAIEKRTWKRDIEVILDWVSLGRYCTFSKRKREEIEEYLLRRGKRNGSRTFFREEEVILVIPASPDQEKDTRRCEIRGASRGIAEETSFL